MRLLIAVLFLVVIVAALVVDLCDQALEHDSPVTVKTAQQWGRTAPPYVVDSAMFTTTTQPRARTAPTKRTAARPVIASGPSALVSDETWDRIALCESGGNWQDNRGGYEGGLHFAPSTWISAGGTRYAEHAYLASRRQQIDIANEWLARTSWAQWPTCSRKVGVR